MARQSRAISVESLAAAPQLILRARYTSTNEDALAELEQTLLAELAPKTAIQRTVAQNIASNEVELLTLRERGQLIFWGGAAREMHSLVSATLDDAEAWDLARAWASGVRDASVKIEALGIEEEFALNAAHVEAFQILGNIDTQIDRLERRRRQLLDDLQRLKSATPIAPDIEDAELVAGA